jgi:hypothetical protein
MEQRMIQLESAFQQLRMNNGMVAGEPLFERSSAPHPAGTTAPAVSRRRHLDVLSDDDDVEYMPAAIPATSAPSFVSYSAKLDATPLSFAELNKPNAMPTHVRENFKSLKKLANNSIRFDPDFARPATFPKVRGADAHTVKLLRAIDSLHLVFSYLAGLVRSDDPGLDAQLGSALEYSFYTIHNETIVFMATANAASTAAAADIAASLRSDSSAAPARLPQSALDIVTKANEKVHNTAMVEALRSFGNSGNRAARSTDARGSYSGQRYMQQSHRQQPSQQQQQQQQRQRPQRSRQYDTSTDSSRRPRRPPAPRDSAPAFAGSSGESEEH